MKDKLYFLVRSIVEDEDSVEITEVNEGGSLNLTVNVAPQDMGRIIGKGGKVIKALRNVMKIPGMKNNIKIFVNLTETPKPE